VVAPPWPRRAAVLLAAQLHGRKYVETGTWQTLALEVPAARWPARMMPARREICSAAAGAQTPDEKMGVTSTKVNAQPVVADV
jgi:hypothetical protein